MPYTIHLNVGYSDNHADWVHFQDDTGEVNHEMRWREFGPFETLSDRFDRLVCLAESVLAEEHVQMLLFE